MTYHDVYIGWLDDPGFSFAPTEERFRRGNFPKRRSPMFPAPRSTHSFDVWRLVINRITAGTYDGRQVDWGAWVARMSKDQLLDFFAEFYTEPACEDEQQENVYLRYRCRQRQEDLAELRSFIASLDPTKTYALVASEL